MNPKVKKLLNSTPVGLILNLALVYVAYFICRMVFLAENYGLYADDLTSRSLLTMMRGGWRFDTSAIFYTNSLFILLYLLPVHVKEGKKWYDMLSKWLFVAINGVCVVMNLADSVFFNYRMQRSTMATFTEFHGEGNLLKITLVELASHWYLLLLAAAMIWGFARFFRKAGPVAKPLWRYYVTNGVTLAVMGLVAVCGMRGNVFFLSATRPISVGYAQRYVSKPVETGIVLNTPFAIIRTIGQTTMPTPDYFTAEELDAIYSPVHYPSDSATVRKRNVVILIVESFAKEFIGGLNQDLDGGSYKGYTPWMDSMLDSCMYFDQMIANTFFSIDAPPAVFASIPRADRPFMTSPHSINSINSIASELKNWGYTSAFFHGADNESLGFSAFMKQAGFDRYYGQNEFYADSRFGGKAEFDGTWGVWDEPFLQFFCAELSEMPQPFVAGVFTLSSHHPFKVPEKYKDRFVDEGIYPLHKCIRYADYSLGRFFEEARKQPWFANTLFVLCADHTSSKRTHAEYKTEMGNFPVPIMFYDPSGTLPRGRQEGISQQIDIMPTVLSFLGYDRPYIAFGKDLLTTPAEQTWAFNWNSRPTYIKGDYMLIFDGEKTVGLYNYRTDRLEQKNLAGKGLPEEKEMEREVKAVMQSYLSRMNSDNVTVK